MAKTLTFDTGIREYDINGAFTARFNPTDESFAARLYKTIDMLEKHQEEVGVRLSAGDVGDVLEFFAEADAEMRAEIDGLLGDGASAALFPGMNCYALSGGLPVWANLVATIADEVAEAYASEGDKTDGRVRAHTEKYEKLLAKYRKRGK